MIVDETKTETHPEFPNHYIQLGISTWTQNLPANEQEESIRRAVYNPDGVFSPHGSSEIPVSDMPLLINTCIKHDKIKKRDLVKIIFKAFLSFIRNLFK